MFSMSLEVLDILKERSLDGYISGYDNDEHNVVISIDSGGMAGSVGCGSLEVLQEEGLLKVVDGYSGASIGAIIASYAALGRIDQIEEAFTEPMTETRFMASNLLGRVASYVSFKRDKTGNIPAAQNMGVLGDIIHGDLDTKNLRMSEVPIVASITSLDEFETVGRDLRELNDNQIIDFLTRGCAFPFVSGQYIGVEGITSRAIDGAFTLLASEQLALSLDPTNILSIGLTPYKKWEYGIKEKLARRIVGMWLAQDAGLGVNIYKKYVQLGDVQAEYLKQFSKSGFTLNGVIVEKVYPRADKDLPGRLTMDPNKIKRGFILGRQAMQTALK